MLQQSILTVSFESKPFPHTGGYKLKERQKENEQAFSFSSPFCT